MQLALELPCLDVLTNPMQLADQFDKFVGVPPPGGLAGSSYRTHQRQGVFTDMHGLDIQSRPKVRLDLPQVCGERSFAYGEIGDNRHMVRGARPVARLVEHAHGDSRAVERLRRPDMVEAAASV